LRDIGETLVAAETILLQPLETVRCGDQAAAQRTGR
jgi:hypothetical protein